MSTPSSRPTASRSSRPRRAWRLAVALTAASALLALAACAGSGGGEDSAGSVAGDAPMADGDFAADEESAADAGAAERAGVVTGTAGGPDSVALAIQRSVISTGNVALRADDVAELRFDVRAVVDEHSGQITDEQTESDTHGKVLRSRLVVRVPAKEFDVTMAALEKVGDVESSQRTSEDVTTQVIDTDVRVRAQEASLQRIEVLLGQATSLRDIVAIEAQLTRRQADLDSLKQQQAWLADQTSMSTITVQLRRTAKEPAADKDDDSGFLAGLAAGWDGLKKVTTGALTAVGALLPFAVALLVVGLPIGYAVRRLMRRRTAAEDEPMDDASPA